MSSGPYGAFPSCTFVSSVVPAFDLPSINRCDFNHMRALTVVIQFLQYRLWNQKHGNDLDSPCTNLSVGGYWSNSIFPSARPHAANRLWNERDTNCI
jgi:hypothetical protein